MDFLNKLDKQQIQKITLIVIAALTILALVLLLVIIVASVNPTNPFGMADGFSDLESITVTDKDLHTGSLVLADDEHKYTYTLDEASLVVFGPYRDANLPKDDTDTPYNKYYMNNQSLMKMTPEAIAAAHNMLVAAEDSVKKDDLLISYTFGFFEGNNEEYKTALLFSLTKYDNGELDSAYKSWFNENASEYGFIESFESGYRYVGIPHAKAISESKNFDSLAGYIAYLKANTNAGKTIKIEADSTEYKIYYATPAEDGTVKVPKNADYTISGTNEGGVIVTVKVK